MADFSNVKVGDKIKYYSRWWSFLHLATVTEVTPRQFKDSRNVKFRKSDGRCINGSCVNCSIVTEEEIAESNRLKLREKMLKEASVLLGMGSFSHKITDEDVQAIYNIINKYR